MSSNTINAAPSHGKPLTATIVSGMPVATHKPTSARKGKDFGLVNQFNSSVIATWALSHNPPPGCDITFRTAFMVNSFKFSKEFLGGHGTFSIWNGSLYVAGRGLEGYITDEYELKFHRLPVSDQLAHRPFSICNNKTLAFSNQVNWYICQRSSGEFLSLSPFAEKKCRKKALNINFLRSLLLRIPAKQGEAPALTGNGSKALDVPHKMVNGPSLNQPAIAGIAVGGAVAITFLIVFAIFFRQTQHGNWAWNWRFKRRRRSHFALGSPIYEKDSSQGPVEVANRPPTNMIDSVPLAELPAMRSTIELPTEMDKKPAVIIKY